MSEPLQHADQVPDLDVEALTHHAEDPPRPGWPRARVVLLCLLLAAALATAAVVVLV